MSTIKIVGRLLASITVLISAAGFAKATEFVGPGTTGSITWEVQNDGESLSDAAGVQVSAQVTPAEAAPYFIIDTQNSVLSGDPIAPGGSKTFTISYRISQDLPSSITEFQVTPSFKVQTEGAVPTTGSVDDDGNISDTSVKCITPGCRFLVENRA